MTGPILVGSFHHADQARHPQPGTCTWDDRPLGKPEPHRFCMPIHANFLQRNDAAQLIGALGSTDGTVRLSVYNNGSGCMVVTDVVSALVRPGGQAPAAQASANPISINDIRARLPAKPRPGSQNKGSNGKSDGAPGGGTLPTPRLNSHGNALLDIVRLLLDPPTLNEYMKFERSHCGNDLVCLMEARATAITVAVRR